jgi:Ca-activated chloride channel family protein
VMGLGLGLDPAQLQAMSHLRGANAFSVTKTDEAAQFVSSEWPWFTTPIAYDLDLEVTASAQLSLDQAYGFPGTFVDDPELDVATVFLSKHKGALLVSLSEEQAGALDTMTATVDLAYTTATGASRTVTLHVDRAGAAVDDRGTWFGQESVGTSTALALLVSGMHDAAQQYADNPQAAQDTMQIAADRFDADTAASTDPQLGLETEFSHALLQLFVDRAPQGTLYGL